MIFTVLGKPPLVNVDNGLQATFYLCAFMVFSYISYNPDVIILNTFLGGLYGFAGMGSFIGYPQRWATYWKENHEDGSAAGQIGMAFWDLALSVAFLSLL